MNSVKIAYIVCSTVFELAFLFLAVVAPMWITPGLYWWTAAAVFLMACTSKGFTDRLNSWKSFGHV